MEDFAAKLVQANLARKNNIAAFVNKTDFDDKLKMLNELSEKVKRLLTKVYAFFLGRRYFASDDG